MNEMQFGNKVRQVLNHGLVGVDDTTAERLRAARERALARQRPEPPPALAWADNVLGGSSGGSFAWRLLLALSVALALGAAIYLYNWQQTQRVEEIEEIDTALLTDDLPIDAYLDRGFQNWLKQQRGAEK